MTKIVQAPDKVLSEVAKPVEKIDKSIKTLLNDMEKALAQARDPEGVGLAAPQIGKSLQIFIIKQTPRSPLLTFINPEILEFFDDPEDKKRISTQNNKTKKAKEKAGIDKGVQLEGCLSLYGIWGVVKRRHGVVISYTDGTGEKHKKRFDGFTATIIQHEIDHLQGTLFPSRVLEQKGKLYKSYKNKDGETEFEEMEI